MTNEQAATLHAAITEASKHLPETAVLRYDVEATKEERTRIFLFIGAQLALTHEWQHGDSFESFLAAFQARLQNIKLSADTAAE